MTDITFYTQRPKNFPKELADAVTEFVILLREQKAGHAYSCLVAVNVALLQLMDGKYNFDERIKLLFEDVVTHYHNTKGMAEDMANVFMEKEKGNLS